ncbi:CPBP family glutamic-type intramembrane protease [uncultured Salegentibacter sp.]|uniref:CPBP family glutamic-type intramembrane protease n=1 Tax=uncultured Salegentibacter sp. TaxID=259320 RepID=UPI0030D8C79E
MNLKHKILCAKWKIILVFYVLACVLTYTFTQFPNLIKQLWVFVTGLEVSFSWNHGLGLFLATIICYLVFKGKYSTSFLGNKPFKSMLVAGSYLLCYSLFGLSNSFNINEHFWAFIFCASMLTYNIFEETAWRGFLHDQLGEIPAWAKGIVTGVLWGLWHILIFKDFSQFGGLAYFVLLSIGISIIMACGKKDQCHIGSSFHTRTVDFKE